MNNYGRVVGIGGQYMQVNKNLRANLDGTLIGFNYRQSERSVEQIKLFITNVD